MTDWEGWLCLGEKEQENGAGLREEEDAGTGWRGRRKMKACAGKGVRLVWPCVGALVLAKKPEEREVRKNEKPPGGWRLRRRKC
jgi:hypothetical protein